MYRTQILHLYRRVRHVNRDMLGNENMRRIGDEYARSEFKSMKNLKKEEDAKFVEKFLGEWEMYCDTIESQYEAKGGIKGSRLSVSRKKHLNDDQKAMLNDLRRNANTV